jgi:protein KIBRA
MTYTQRGVETLYSVEKKLNSHQNGCYNLSEAQAIMEEVRKIQKSLISGEREKKELMKSLAQVKDDLTRLQLRQESPDTSTFNLAQDRIW